MNIDDLHDIEDYGQFEIFSDQSKNVNVKATQVENVKENNFGYTSARRVSVVSRDEEMDDKWSKFSI
jgi:hypothetical protein